MANNGDEAYFKDARQFEPGCLSEAFPGFGVGCCCRGVLEEAYRRALEHDMRI